MPTLIDCLLKYLAKYPKLYTLFQPDRLLIKFVSCSFRHIVLLLRSLSIVVYPMWHANAIILMAFMEHKNSPNKLFPMGRERERERGRVYRGSMFRKLQLQRLALCQRFNLQALTHTLTHTHMCKQSAIITMCMLWDLWEPQRERGRKKYNGPGPNHMFCKILH